MLEFLSIVPLAQVVTSAPPVAPSYLSREVLRVQEIRPLPGQLNTVPVFNSNSPEVIQSEGVLLSTFPPNGMRSPQAHLNYPLQGRFDFFAHHIARGVRPGDVRTMYMGILVYNPTNRTVTLDVLQASSYLTQEAPFYDLPSYLSNPVGSVFAGPGSRATDSILRGNRQLGWPNRVTIPPQSSRLLVNLPIPLRDLSALQNGVPLPQHLLPADPTEGLVDDAANPLGALGMPTGTGAPAGQNQRPPTNGRTVLMHLNSDGPIYMANLAMYARINANGSERAPSMTEWESMLVQGQLVTPRDHPPTPPNQHSVARMFYGRVAGIAQGSEWTARLTDTPNSDYLSIPQPGQAISYLIASLERGTFGTGQVQSAPMLARYPDTAYLANGNYGIHYNLNIPLVNNTDTPQTVSLTLQTPLKDAEYQGGLRFLNPPDDNVFFRGTVRLQYEDDFGVPTTRYLHVVQRRGQEGEPLVQLRMRRRSSRTVQVDFLYPPDSTPPQVFTIQTNPSILNRF